VEAIAFRNLSTLFSLIKKKGYFTSICPNIPSPLLVSFFPPFLAPSLLPSFAYLFFLNKIYCTCKKTKNKKKQKNERRREGGKEAF